MLLTKEQIGKLDDWSQGGGKAVGTIRCDKCGKHPKFYVQLNCNATLSNNTSQWTLCTKCAKYLTHKNPLRVFRASTGLPTGKSI